MRLFCREDHSKRDLVQELVEARAHLASTRLMPESDFTRYANLGSPHRYIRGPILEYGVDAKPKAISRAKADIAELKVLIRSQS